MFVRPEDSHAHSLQTLNAFYEYDDFMESIATVVDLGCGNGLDLEWWATRTTRDEVPIPLNIRCVGVDLLDQLPVARKYSNITYQKTDFESEIFTPSDRKFDVLWCHDAFQYCVNPLATLAKWWHMTSDGGMLAIVVPQTTNVFRKKLAFSQQSICYYHHTLVSLIHMLSVTGWDCRDGFFLKRPDDVWLHAVVYKSSTAPMNPSTTTWYDLADTNLLPETAKDSVMKHGFLQQQDLILPWIDKSLSWLGQQ